PRPSVTGAARIAFASLAGTVETAAPDDLEPASGGGRVIEFVTGGAGKFPCAHSQSRGTCRRHRPWRARARHLVDQLGGAREPAAETPRLRGCHAGRSDAHARKLCRGA